ncbi:hypothetical protein FSP39_013093 [Pinctada imbricata]|uniref:HECT domain-containing protein n=1 Tax=Pinctada imbricata TaxID=66713 RepID=A0AA88YEA3_PINIB|nr:hypothetical protein FSP39_013093 [Pinctada imbricata]
MNDRELSKFIPLYGDRIALRSFLQKEEANKRRRSKVTLVTSLRQKLKEMRRSKTKNTEGSITDGSDDHEEHDDRNPFKGNQNATKNTRKVKLGIKVNVDNCFVSVRTKKGGGPRDIQTPKTAKKKDLIEQGKMVYFGSTGHSKLGDVKDYDFDMQNYEEEIFDDKKTVGELYEETGFSKLTFYLLLTPSAESLPEITLCKRKRPNDTDSQDLSFPSDGQDSHVLDSLSEQKKENETGNKPGPSSDKDFDGFDLLSEAMATADLPCVGLNSEEQANDAYFPLDFLDFPMADRIAGNIENNHRNEDHAFDESENAPVGEKTVRIHRVNLLNEMIVIFKEPSIVSETIKFQFINESGSDLNGVSRDVYSSFWIEFFRRASEGEETRVPAINSHWQSEEWKAIGRILAKGFLDHKIFPIQLSPVTATVLAFGEDAVNPESLFQSFLLYLSKTDRDLLEGALKQKLTEEENDELLELLDRFGCTVLPNKDNIKSLIDQIAHKELIQKAKYCTDNMALACREELLTRISSVDNLMTIYKDLEPTPRKVIKLLDASPKSSSETSALRFLQQYIRGQNSIMLRKLLRFLTGSEILTVSKIEVIFTQLEGFSRRPVAHTCGPVLELPSTYSSYPELRNEFENILSDDSCFVMNIV